MQARLFLFSAFDSKVPLLDVLNGKYRMGGLVV